MKKTVLIVVCVMLAAALVFSGCAENQQGAASASQPGEEMCIRDRRRAERRIRGTGR